MKTKDVIYSVRVTKCKEKHVGKIIAALRRAASKAF